MTPQNAVLMAQYNRWMNERMYAAAATLPDGAVAAEVGAFFGSILGTLNHIAVADTIWLHRFARHVPPFASLQALAGFPMPASLREPLAADLPGLQAYRARLDAIIDAWAGELTPAHLHATLSYTNMAGMTFRRGFGALVQHFFNHQTHHRGQVSTLLLQAGVDIGITDLYALLADETPGAPSRALEPQLHPGRYAFVPLPDGARLDVGAVVASVREAEGITVVVEERMARDAGWPVAFVAAWISLGLATGLDELGLTAHFSRALADAGIACNTVAGVHHDHLFVPVEQGAAAVELLRGLVVPGD